MDKGEIVDLKKKYPIANRFVLRASFWWMLICVGSAAVLWLLYLHYLSSEQVPLLASDLALKKLVIVAGTLVVFLVRTVYLLLFRWTYAYALHNKRLIVSRGVILREEASIPLTLLTELYLKRSWLDLLFGLNNLYIASPLERIKQIALIEGLSSATARALKSYLVGQLPVAAQSPVSSQSPSESTSAADFEKTLEPS